MATTTNKLSEQKQAIMDKLTALGFSIESVCIDKGDWRKKPNRWKVTIKRGNQSFTTDYQQGSAYGKHSYLSSIDRHRWEPYPPTLVSVMSCLVSDANCVRYGQTFEDFASDFGYDTDSRKAESMFNACRDIWFSLLRLGCNLDELTELFQDY